MNQRGESAGIDHELRRLAVQFAVDVKIPAFCHANRHVFPTAVIYSRHGAARVRVEFHEQDLFFAIKHGLGGEENVGPEDAVEFLLVKFSGGAGWRAQIDRDHRLIDQDEGAEAELVRNGDTAEAAVDAQPWRELGRAGDPRHAEMFAPRGRDRTDWRTRVDAEEGRFAVDFRPEQKMILLRAFEWQGLKFRILERRLGAWLARAEGRGDTEERDERRAQTMAKAAGAGSVFTGENSTFALPAKTLDSG